MKRVEITLTKPERQLLERICNQGIRTVRELTRAQVLLALDRGTADQTISEVLGVERTRIWRLRKRYLCGGVNAALPDRPRAGRPSQVDATLEAEIVATACSAPPTGRNTWTLGLIAEVVSVQCEILQISHKSVGRVLKKRCKPWLKEMWCIGEITKQYRQRMYHLIDLYHQPYNAKHPVVCIDEKSKQLLASVRPPIALTPGSAVKEDYEYERRGTRNLFVAVEPQAGWRQVSVTSQRCKADFVEFIQHLLNTRYRQAETVHLVLDNLNIHFAKVFVDVLGKRKANRLLKRVVFHYTPKHGSWLNLAEVEISILGRQCLNRRISTEAELKSEVEAWQAERNAQNKMLNWSFTKAAADQKLGRHYVA